MSYRWGKYVMLWLVIASLGLSGAVAWPTPAAWGQEATPEIKRVAVPKAADQDAARKLLLDLFRGDYEQAKTADEKTALAQKMLQVGNDTHDDAAGQYMLYQIARELAISVANTEAALRAIDAQGTYFEIDAPVVKLDTVTAVEKTLKLTKDRQAMVGVLDQLVDEFLLANRYDLAKNATALTLDLARKVPDPNAIKLAGVKLKDIETREKLFGEVQAARKVLETRPDDPTANTTVGRFLCLINGDWNAGLPLLAKSGDPKLKAAAEKELTQPQEPAQQMEAGDAWWDVAEKESGTLQQALQQRSAGWYEAAMPGLSGLAKLKITGRLEKLAPKADGAPATASTTPSKPATPPVKPGVRPTQKLITNTIGMRMVLIPAGTFIMGSPQDESGRNDDETQHRVKLTKPFYMGMTEVTQEQWVAVMGTRPWQKDQMIPTGALYPVNHVTWADANEFCRKLTAKENKTYRLPTEAEWEYACRAGTMTRFYSGTDMSDLDVVGWFGSNRDNNLILPVAQKTSNAAGLFDMHGNVTEWCSDWKGDYSNKDAVDPQGATRGMERILRGGSTGSSSSSCRSASRRGYPADSTYYGIGFRAVYDPLAPAAGATPAKSSSTPSVSPTVPRMSTSGSSSLLRPSTSPASGAQKLETMTNSLGMKLVRIPAGTFMMGSPEGQSGPFKDETQHRVTLTKPFYLGVTEVTQRQWITLMGTQPWQDQKQRVEGANYPANYLSFETATEFCRKLGEKEGKTYRLPTEAEWEYACRAGSTTAFGFGNDESMLKDYGWFRDNHQEGGETYFHLVAQLRPNAWGLYDMHGNLKEFCSDRYGAYPEGDVTDPTGATESAGGIARGGMWGVPASWVRSAIRGGTAGSAQVPPTAYAWPATCRSQRLAM